VKHTNCFVERLYPVPNVYYSQEQWERYNHADLPLLSDQELQAERRRVQFALDWSGKWPDPWYRERFEAVQAEFARRRAEQAREVSS